MNNAKPKMAILTEEEATPYRKLFEAATTNRLLFEREYDRLIREHDGEWVAVDNGELIYAPTLERLIANLKAKGNPPAAFVKWVRAVRPPMVLASNGL